MLFNKFRGLSLKIYVAFLITAVLPVTIAGMVSIFYSLEVLKNETLYHLKQELANKADNMARFIKQLRSDVLYLESNTTTLNLMAAMTSRSEIKIAIARSSLEHDFAAFIRTYPYVHKMLFLSTQGVEIVRVEHYESGAKIIPLSERNESKRYNVHDILKLEMGEIYILPTDFYAESGKGGSQKNHQLRFAIPVADQTGVVQGIIVINFHAEFFIEQIQQLALARGGTTYLFNPSAFYFACYTDSALKTPQFEIKPISKLNNVFLKTILQNIKQRKRQIEIIDHQIIAYAPVVVNTLLPHSATTLTEWIVVMVYPQQQLFATILNLHILYGLMTVCILVALIAGFYMSRYLLRPLSLLHKRTEEVAKGNFSQRIVVKGTDEIANLGHSLNSMSAQLEQMCECLERRKVQLEEEVAARTSALEHERQNLATIIEHVGDGILSVDSLGYIHLANEAAALFLNIPKNKMIGRRIENCCPHWSKLYEVVHTNRQFELKMGERTLVVNVTPESVMGDTHSCLALVRDVSEERRRVDHCRELDRQMFQMEKMATMGELVMGLTHEIGNPLTGMKTVVQGLLEEETLTDHLRKNLYRILNEVDRLADFLQTFHGFSAPQETHPIPSQLDEVLEDVFLWTHKEAKSKGIQIINPQNSVKIPKLWADPHQLKQALLNVMINAIHAIENGGNITIGMCVAETCRKRLHDNESYVRFCIWDSGPGIPPKILQHVFDPFFTTRENGSGLGLAVVKKIVDQHNATIQVDSQPGQGTRFEFIWPVALEKRPKVQANIKKPSFPLCQEVCVGFDVTSDI